MPAWLMLGLAVIVLAPAALLAWGLYVIREDDRRLKRMRESNPAVSTT